MFPFEYSTAASLINRFGQFFFKQHVMLKVNTLKNLRSLKLLTFFCKLEHFVVTVEYSNIFLISQKKKKKKNLFSVLNFSVMFPLFISELLIKISYFCE